MSTEGNLKHLLNIKLIFSYLCMPLNRILKFFEWLNQYTLTSSEKYESCELPVRSICLLCASTEMKRLTRGLHQCSLKSNILLYFPYVADDIKRTRLVT